MDELTPANIRTWLRSVMDWRGWGPTEWARKSGVAKSTITRALDPNYEFVTSARTLRKLADAAGVAVLGGSGKPGFVPIIGMVGADPEGRVLFADGQRGQDLAPVPPGGSETGSALEVRGHSMPFFAEDGALIYFEAQFPQPLRDMLGRVVVVETETGEVLVKRLLRGSEPGLFDLESINGPTRHDERLRWAAFVTAVIPPPKSQQMILRMADGDA